MKIVRLNLYLPFIALVLLMLFLCFLIFNPVIKTNATPITNKIVVLDAGHGLPDNGTSASDGTTEQKINLDIVLKLQNIIEQSGAKVVLTRSDENGIYEVDKNSIRDKKVSDMKNRVYIGNNSEANIYVSIHLNYFEQSKYSGWQTFYQTKSIESKKLANVIQKSLSENIDKNKDRNIMAIKGAYIMDRINIPSVIVECGFISNVNEREKLKTKEYQSKLAWSIYAGIQKYFGGKL